MYLYMILVCHIIHATAVLFNVTYIMYILHYMYMYVCMYVYVYVYVCLHVYVYDSCVQSGG